MAELRTPVCNFLQQILQADGLDVCVKVGFVTVDDQVLFYDRGVHLFNSLQVFLWHEKELESSFCAEFSIDLGHGIHYHERRTEIHEFGSHFYGIAGKCGILEFNAVQAGIHGSIDLKILSGYQQYAALRHDFAHDDSWHDGISREVPLHEPCVLRNGEFGFYVSVFEKVGFVHEEHWSSVGNDFLNFFSVHRSGFSFKCTKIIKFVRIKN